jgi:uncharacterized protein YpuA (DUF1002 family)
MNSTEDTEICPKDFWEKVQKTVQQMTLKQLTAVNKDELAKDLNQRLKVHSKLTSNGHVDYGPNCKTENHKPINI